MPMNPRLLRPRASANVVPRFNGIGGWFDATDSSTYTLDTGVTEWRCKAVSGQKFTQTIGANQPTINSTGIGGKPALSFDGSNDFMDLGSTSFGGNTLFADAANAFSLFIVFRINAVSGTLFSQAVGVEAQRVLHVLFGVDGYQGLSAVARGTRSNGPTISSNTDTLGAITWSGSSMTSRVNNSASALTVGTAAISSQNISIGARTPSAPFFFLNGRIGEIIFYNRILTGSEQSALFSYLNAKWGLSLT